MSIPYVRLKADCDDGVSEYQCLNCYNTWRAQTGPENWKMCPICGCKWSGMKKTKQKKYYDCPDARTERITCCRFFVESRFISYTNGKPEKPLEWVKDQYPIFRTANIAFNVLQDKRNEEKDWQQEQLEENGQIYLGVHEYRLTCERGTK